MIAISVAFQPLQLWADPTAPSVVTIQKKDDGSLTLLRNGQPFFICGVGGPNHLELLKQLGGNSIRTWGIEELDHPVDGKPMIDRAHELGLAVTAGIWLEHERHGFNYSDPEQVEKQRQKVRDAVQRYKNHPALLIWGLGNEMEGPTSDGKDVRIWKEVNYLAGMIKELDPNHPVMTVIAGPQDLKIRSAKEYCTNVDILGINGYASAPGAGSAVVANGWDKPFILTEFGPMGHWEVPKTDWGAPIEPSSTQKAASYYATQKNVISDSRKICLGSYAFLWGYKQEATSTWYGMFLKSGEKVGPVDAMSFAWTGKWPATRCPILQDIQSDFAFKRVAGGQKAMVHAPAKNLSGDTLSYQWVLMDESTDRRVGGDDESVPTSHPECIGTVKDDGVEITLPSKPGAYRLFVYVLDTHGDAATANVPFYIN